MGSLNLPGTSEDPENLIGQIVCACQPDTGSAVMAPVVRSVSELSLSHGVLGSNAASCLGTQPKLFCMGHACTSDIEAHRHSSDVASSGDKRHKIEKSRGCCGAKSRGLHLSQRHPPGPALQ